MILSTIAVIALLITAIAGVINNATMKSPAIRPTSLEAMLNQCLRYVQDI